MTENAKKIILKWYKKLDFPSEYDAAFNNILSTENIDESITDIKQYDTTEKNGKKNLLMALYLLEFLKKRYDEEGIPESIFSDTFHDIVRITERWTKMNGELCLFQLDWLSKHYNFELFQIENLQFCKSVYFWDIPEHNIKKGKNVVGVHIPAGSSIDIYESQNAFVQARKFFDKYFPEYDFDCFSCYSWLMDDTLEKYLSPDSNILKFQKLFKIIREEKSYSILRFIFGWFATAENINEYEATSSFAKKIKTEVLKGTAFYEGYGIREK